MLYKYDLGAERALESCGHCYFKDPVPHPDRTIPVHDMIYMVEGEWSIGVEDREYLLKKDRVLILNTGLRHYPLSPCSPHTKTIFLHVYPAPGDAPASWDGAGCIPSMTDCSANPRIKRLFEDLVFFADNPGPESGVIISCMCRLLLAHLSRMSRPTADQDPVLYMAVKNIKETPQRFFTEEELAEIAGVSVKTLRKRFRDRFGLSPRAWQMQQKLNMISSALITHRDIPLKALADNYGFCDEFYLSRCFRARFGMPPGEYRKIHLL